MQELKKFATSFAEKQNLPFKREHKLYEGKQTYIPKQKSYGTKLTQISNITNAATSSRDNF